MLRLVHVLPLMVFVSMTTPAAAQSVAFTGATVWDGTGAESTAGVTILVRDGAIAAIGTDVDIPASARVVSLEGRFVIPGLVNAHGHVSGDWALDPDADEPERIREDLLLYARYGVTSVLSLGDSYAAIDVARAPLPTAPHARLMAAGPVVTSHDPGDAAADARAHAEAGADWLKLRVDDNLGTSRPMPWPAVEAVMDVGRERSLPVATHLYYLEDARRLLEMGSGMIAHSVRDRPVDDAFVAALEAADVCYVPTLTRELSTYVYGTRPDFFDDPFFQRYALEREVRRLEEPDVQRSFRESRAGAAYREALGRASANLLTMHRSGAPVAMGTDSGPSARFPGYFEHLELWMMVDAGLTPAETLRAATATAATCAGFDDVGTLEPGRQADFLVLARDPLEDIEATRSLERVFVAGREVS